MNRRIPCTVCYTLLHFSWCIPYLPAPRLFPPLPQLQILTFTWISLSLTVAEYFVEALPPFSVKEVLGWAHCLSMLHSRMCPCISICVVFPKRWLLCCWVFPFFPQGTGERESASQKNLQWFRPSQVPGRGLLHWHKTSSLNMSNHICPKHNKMVPRDWISTWSAPMTPVGSCWDSLQASHQACS